MANLADALEYDQRKRQMLSALQAGTDVINRGSIAGTLGAPVDLANTALQAVGLGSDKPVLGSEWIGDKMQRAGMVSPERRPVAEFAAGFINPETATTKAALLAKALASKSAPLHAIVSPILAKKLTTKLELPTHEDFHAAIQNTPGAEITPEGLKLSVLRQQLPDQAGAESVRTGVFYLPASDPKKHVYSGKYGYGGAEKFEGETLLKRPLFVKGATGGNAPAQAYDQLMGKGAYENMRRDAIGVFNARDKIGATMDVLNKYGANPDLAHDIVRNSKLVNQLPYAIQENIVAHAVRSAGYDGVLGYSKTKTGPRLSELFDTRELTYPAEGMEPDIHDAYW